MYRHNYMYKLNCIVIIDEIFKVLPFWPLEFAQVFKIKLGEHIVHQKVDIVVLQL